MSMKRVPRPLVPDDGSAKAVFVILITTESLSTDGIRIIMKTVATEFR